MKIRLRQHSGFALPMVIMVIGFMTAGVLAAFARTGAEVQIVDSQRSQTAAFATAEAGLQRYMATKRLPGPGTTTTTVVDTLNLGTVTIITTAHRIRAAASATDTTSPIWLIRSQSFLATASGRPQGTRTVAQLVYRSKGQMQVLSAWTSLSGLRKAGSSGDMTGNDACSGASLPGVAVPTGGFTGQSDAISGSPPISEMGTAAEMASGIKINWNGIVDASSPALQADYVYCVPGSYGYDAGWGCNGWPSNSAWTTMIANNMWPTVIINGSSALPSNGQGTLIVTGDLTLGGGDVWNGIILVGGAITDNGSGNVSGAVVTGLNMLRPSPWPSTVTESSRANGTKDYTYDSCKVANASDSQSRLVPISNAWVDNWTAW